MHPVRFAIPPDGSARVDPQIEQVTEVEALSKIVHSFPQSRQLTFRNLPATISSPSVVHKFELSSSLPLGRVCLSSFGAPVD